MAMHCASRWAVALACGYSLATSEATSLSPGFGALDVDGDGMLSQEEAAESPELVRQWQRLDRDGSGSLDRTEFEAFTTAQRQQPAAESVQPDHVVARFRIIDQNGDGRIGPEEAAPYGDLVEQWLALDSDESGDLSLGEFSRSERARHPPSIASGVGAPPPAQFTELDRNGDGRISRDEAAANRYLLDNWRELDRNQSGDLDRSEFSVFEEIFLDEPAGSALSDVGGN